MTGRRLRRGLGPALVAVLTTLSMAGWPRTHGALGTTGDTVADPVDVPSGLDIAGAVRGGDATAVQFIVRTYAAFTDAAADFRILIDQNGDGTADTWVLVDFDPASGRMRAGVGPAGSVHLEPAAVYRLTPDSVEVTFPREAVAGSSAFDWAVAAESPGASGGAAVIDLAPDAPTVRPPAPVRVVGPDRIGTAVASSFYAAGDARAVVLARSDDYADALAGAPLAVTKGGPLLLTPPSRLDPRVEAEIRRCLPSGGVVYLLGGADALGAAVEDAVRSAGYETVRLGGSDRYATSLAVLQQGLGSVSTVFLATGRDFPDALSAGAAAGSTGGAVLLTDGTSLTPAVATYLDQNAVKAYAVGDPAAAAYGPATPLVGPDRYATAAEVARAFFPRPTVVGVASGENFPDALAGAAAMGQGHGPLLLTGSGALAGATRDYLLATPTATVYLFGGPHAVGQGVADAIRSALGY
ncbi:MAG TPA: cell wall-binding repeat-containing protein [Acidimicrobiales bacterium]|nr:cell wall-binding repeat-containing protein [Acidimicrobiales bacterium]